MLDFGIVKALGDAREPDQRLTRENTVPGSPAFIAPEQAVGTAVVDGRADIYATGCVGYWLLTGQPVFTADGQCPLWGQVPRPQVTRKPLARPRSGRALTIYNA